MKDLNLAAYLDPLHSRITADSLLDEFDLRYARRIWPGITKQTKVLAVLGDRNEFTILGNGTETINLIDCNEARFLKWGYAPGHDMLIVIESFKKSPDRIAVWDTHNWHIPRDPVSKIDEA